MARIKITDLDHIVLNVGNIEQSLLFYTEILGLTGERVDEFKAGKVGFPSVRINAATIIDLFPNKERSYPRAGAKVDGNLNHFCLVVGADDFADTVDYLKEKQIGIPRRAGVALGRARPGDLGLFPRSRWQRD
jgi:catechol 2,3-dioxygenase-like lactoylglutathione lyase family enzyme